MIYIGMLVVVLIILLGVYYVSTGNKIDRLESDLEWYKKAIQTKQGWSQGFGSYKIVSFDGGDTWYNYEPNSDPEASRSNGFHFLTPADTVLVKHLKAWDALTNHVEKNGPLDLSTDEQLKIMEDVGFTIKADSIK